MPPLSLGSSILTMDLYFIAIIIFMVVRVQAEDYNTVSNHFSLNSHYHALTVLEGAKVTLTCPKESSNVFIMLANPQILEEGYEILIDSSSMTDISIKYGFNETSGSMYTFTIYRVSRDDEGAYVCFQGRAITLTVIYSPSESSPKCSSNYYLSPIIFFDEIKDDFVFNCSTERGKPPVITKIYVNEQEVTSNLDIINETRSDEEKTIHTLTIRLTEALDNSTFVCNVTQQLPSPYEDYQGSCFIGPLHILSGFSMSVSPSNVTVREGDRVTLICASSETGVEITWINIPSVKYIVRNYDQSSELTIVSYKPNLDKMVPFMCQGSYGRRNVTRNVSVYPALDLNDRKQYYPWQRFLITSVVSFSALVCVLVTVTLLLFRYRNKTNDNEATDPKQDATLTEKYYVNLSTTYTNTVSPESVETEEIRRVHDIVPTYDHTIVTDDTTPTDTMSSKPSALYDSGGYLIPNGYESIGHENRIYEETDQ